MRTRSPVGRRLDIDCREFAAYLKSMAATSDHYATLEVKPGVDAASIRRAYRDLMRRYHPDVTDCEDAEERCRAINEAYACLRDPETRAHYDAHRRARQRSRRASFMAETMPIQPTVHGNRKDWLGDEDEQSRGRKVMVVGAAILLTIATFVATSAVDPPDVVVMQARPAGDMSASR